MRTSKRGKEYRTDLVEFGRVGYSWVHGFGAGPEIWIGRGVIRLAGLGI